MVTETMSVGCDQLFSLYNWNKLSANCMNDTTFLYIHLKNMVDKKFNYYLYNNM